MDPVLTEINQDLSAARKLVDESSQAAAESWSSLQKSVDSALETLRKSVTEAADRLTKR